MNKLVQVLYKFGVIRAKNKKRKKTGFLFFNPNKTFYLTFVLSILFHLALIYSIPAVNLFSESPAGLAMEPAIVVDLLEVDSIGNEADIAPIIEENQFQSSAPEMPETPPLVPEPDTLTPEPEFTEDDLATRFPTVDDLETDALLLAQSFDPVPQLESLRKRNPEQSSLEFRRRQPEQQTEKLTTMPLPLPTQRETQHDELEKVAMIPFRARETQLPEQSERRPAFPLQIPSRSTDRPAPTEQPLQLTTRRTIPADRDDIPFNPAIDGNALASSKRRIGMDRYEDTDQNRFGIFAGSEYDDMRIKEDMQKTIFEGETKEAAPLLPEESTQVALPTDMNIEGPVKGRKIIRRPSPPKVDVTRGVDLQLKFWVLPDGTIGKVVPLKRGDAQLERIAINYLKQWQFEPLPAGASQQKIWGTIPIRFIVR